MCQAFFDPGRLRGRKAPVGATPLYGVKRVERARHCSGASVKRPRVAQSKRQAAFAIDAQARALPQGLVTGLKGRKARGGHAPLRGYKVTKGGTRWRRSPHGNGVSKTMAPPNRLCERGATTRKGAGPQRGLRPSTLQLFNSSTLQRFNASTLQRFNASTLEPFN